MLASPLLPPGAASSGQRRRSPVQGAASGPSTASEPLCHGAGGVAVHSAWPQRSPNHGIIISKSIIRRISVQPVVREEFSSMKCSINMVLIGDLWSRVRTNDSHAPCAAVRMAERLRGRRRASRAGSSRALIYPEVVFRPRTGGLGLDLQ